ncbi:hypothetical protein [Atlantibacter hermannii]|uniref:hypothetical protein n=1 Tax=Atlantibacter hermannii TaxID=565 RepID=UPI002FDCFE9E
MKDNELALVLNNDWLNSPSDHIYRGKYTVGQLLLTSTFIVEYMRLIRGIEIPDSWLGSSFINVSDTDTRKVMYMEGCDMLSKDTMHEIRNAVKSPSDKVKVYRSGNHVTKIEFMEERNEITL